MPYDKLLWIHLSDGTVQTVNVLGTKEARQGWERIFNQHYVQPVLTNLDQKLTKMMDLVVNDEQQGSYSHFYAPQLTSLVIVFTADHDQLFYLAYEKVKYAKESLEPHLWTYRSRITLEHLRQSLHDKKMKQKYPILHEFLQAVSHAW